MTVPARPESPPDARHRRRRRPTAVASAGLVAAAAAVVAFDATHGPPLPPPPPSAFGRAAMPSAPRPSFLPVWRERVDTLAPSETLTDALARAGVSPQVAERALRAAPTNRARLSRPGSAVYVRALAGDSVPVEITLRPAVDRVLRLRYIRGVWRAGEERLAWRTDTVSAEAAVTSSLDDAVHVALGVYLPRGHRAEVVDRLADIYEHRVDVSDELEPGDSVRLVIERRLDPEGVPHEPAVLAASISTGGRSVEAIRYTSGARQHDYYDAVGRSLREGFLRAPLAFRRVSSRFGMRHHPVLGFWRMHAGTDYAAPAGTPVRAVGDGTVLFAGRSGGYGNVIEVRHANGYVSRYGHLRRFERGTRRGAFVAKGATIGYVGSTGLSTAPHLHFEMRYGGAARDPRAALERPLVTLLPDRERGAFAAVRARLLGRAASALGTTRGADAE